VDLERHKEKMEDENIRELRNGQLEMANEGDVIRIGMEGVEDEFGGGEIDEMMLNMEA